MSQLIEILDKIPNGHELYQTDPLVNRVVDSLRLGNDPVKIIGNLFGIINAYQKKLIEFEQTGDIKKTPIDPRLVEIRALINDNFYTYKEDIKAELYKYGADRVQNLSPAYYDTFIEYLKTL